jgi:hypothetical protein
VIGEGRRGEEKCKAVVHHHETAIFMAVSDLAVIDINEITGHEGVFLNSRAV